jgi:hypothetical protein
MMSEVGYGIVERLKQSSTLQVMKKGGHWVSLRGLHAR